MSNYNIFDLYMESKICLVLTAIISIIRMRLLENFVYGATTALGGLVITLAWNALKKEYIKRKRKKLLEKRNAQNKNVE